MSAPSYRILVTDPLHPDGRALLAQDPRVTVVEVDPKDQEALARVLPEVDGWIIRSGTKVTAQHLDLAPRLRAIARAGVGVDNVDLTHATRRGVVVMNAPDANAITTAELTIAHLLSLSRHLVAGDRMVRSGGWRRKDLVGIEVEGKTLGVLGLGRIGRRVAGKARGLGMQVLGHDPYVSPGAMEGTGVEVVDLDTLLARADFLSLHVPLTKDTRGILGRENLAKVKPGVRIINCARGALVDDEALKEALDDGRVAGAALDVFQQEPPPETHPLLGHPGVVVTPHLGASTEEAARNVSLAVARQMLDVLDGRCIVNAVNLPSLGDEAWEEMAPYMALARQTGRFLSQVIDWPVTAVRAEYRGQVADDDVRPLTLSFLQGLLSPVMDCTVNLVNARPLAEERGIAVDERRSRQPRDFQSLLCFEADGPRGTRRIAGALFGNRMLRIVILDDMRLEVMPEGHLLVLRNQDRPGVIGKIGTMFGSRGVNIGNMHVSGPAADGHCYAVLSLSEAPDDELFEQVKALPEIEDARRVDLT